MTIPKVVLAVVASAGLGLASMAHATVGGPTTVDVLGWSATEQRVYVHEIPHHAGGAFGRVLAFELGAPPDAPPTEVEWTRGLSGEGSMDDPEANRRLAALRDRLKPLPPQASTALPWRHEVVGRDTLHRMGDATARFRVRASLEAWVFDVTTFLRSDVVLRDMRAIPGRPEVLVVLAFIGDPQEGGYETQVAHLMRPGEGGPHPIEWRHFE